MIHITTLSLMLFLIYMCCVTNIGLFKTSIIILIVELIKKFFNDALKLIRDFPDIADDPDISVSNIYSR